MNSKTISIEGMHCKSCELLIEDELKTINGVSTIDISHKTGLATIHFDGKNINHADVVHAVRKAGYELGSNVKPALFSKNINDYIELGFGTVILILVYYTLKSVGLFDFKFIKSNTFTI